MIWAVDQGTSDGATNDEYSGLENLEKHFTNRGLSLDNSFGLRNGLQLKGVVKAASKRSEAEDTCYTSFCGESCVPGYIAVSTMNGQVGGLGEATACQEENVQTLCCPSGTFTGRCEWYGWRGQGLSCSGTCAEGDEMIAKNTNHICKSAIMSSLMYRLIVQQTTILNRTSSKTKHVTVATKLTAVGASVLVRMSKTSNYWSQNISIRWRSTRDL